MSRQLEEMSERRSVRRHLAIVKAVEFELERSVGAAGGDLQGFAFKNRGSDCLLILKVILAGKAQVAFVGGEDLGSCLIKAVREAKGDKLKWREDKYVGQS